MPAERTSTGQYEHSHRRNTRHRTHVHGRALRRFHSLGGGAPVTSSPPPVQKISGAACGAALSAQFFIVAYLVQTLFSKNLCYKYMDVQQLFFAVFWRHIRENNYYENSLSITKTCKTMQAEVQDPTSCTNSS